MKRHLILLFLYTVAWYTGNAQTLDVISITPSDTQLAIDCVDQKGRICAAVELCIDAIDGTMIDDKNVMKRDTIGGHGYVFVKEGTKRITVSHPNYPESEINFKKNGIEIQGGQTYHVELKPSAEVYERIIEKPQKSVYLDITVEPSDAQLIVNGEKIETREGKVCKLMPLGVHSFVASAEMYHTKVSKFEVSKQSTDQKIELQPNFGWIEFTAEEMLDGATVSIDNKEAGKVPFQTGRLKSGPYQVSINKEYYKAYHANITVTDGETIKVSPQLEPNYSDVTFTVENGAEIWIDGVQKGRNKVDIRLESGTCLVETRLPKHKSVCKEIAIPDHGTHIDVQLENPIPMIGYLEVAYSPDSMSVYLSENGGQAQYLGKTPLKKTPILAGTYTIEIDSPYGRNNKRGVTIREDLVSRIEGAILAGRSGAKGLNEAIREVGNCTRIKLAYRNENYIEVYGDDGLCVYDINGNKLKELSNLPSLRNCKIKPWYHNLFVAKEEKTNKSWIITKDGKKIVELRDTYKHDQFFWDNVILVTDGESNENVTCCIFNDLGDIIVPDGTPFSVKPGNEVIKDYLSKYKGDRRTESIIALWLKYDLGQYNKFGSDWRTDYGVLLAEPNMGLFRISDRSVLIDPQDICLEEFSSKEAGAIADSIIEDAILRNFRQLYKEDQTIVTPNIVQWYSSDGMYFVLWEEEKDDAIYVVDQTGLILHQYTEEEASTVRFTKSSIGTGMLVHKLDGGYIYNLVDLNLQPISSKQYRNIIPLTNSYIVEDMDGKYQAIGKNGNVNDETANYLVNWGDTRTINPLPNLFDQNIRGYKSAKKPFSRGDISTIQSQPNTASSSVSTQQSDEALDVIAY